MALPEELHMPSLADLGNNLGTLMLNIGFARGGPRDDLLRRHFVNIVRLVDLSVCLYEKARANLKDALPGGENRFGAVLSAINQLELCVITVRRALNALQAVASYPRARMIDRLARRALESFDGPLRKVRDAVIHVEADISRGDLSPGMSHVLMVADDGRTASIGKHQVILDDLGRAIRKLHELAIPLAEYREADQPA